MAFLECQEDPQLLWKVLEDTWKEVSISQFPEVKTAVLSMDMFWISVRQELLARLLADDSMEVGRDENIFQMQGIKKNPMEIDEMVKTAEFLNHSNSIFYLDRFPQS